MKTIVLVVHGVGFFNEKEVVEETRRRFEKTSISPATILPFNWDSRTTTFFDRVSIGRDADLTFLAEVGEGILRATHAGFLSKTAKYGGLPKHLLRFQNALSLVLQILCLAAAALLCLNFSLLWLPMAWLGRFLLVVVILALLITATGIASGSFLGVCVSARRVLLSLAWPVVYCFAVCVATPFYLLITSFIASALVLAYLGKHWGVIIFSQQTNAFSDGLVYLVGSAVLFSLVVTAGIVLQRITQPFFKAVADVVRYIGVESYRNRIQHEVKELIEAIPEHPATNLIVLAHSLGSVIITDFLTSQPKSSEDFSSISLVTMGSPLRRTFWRFFPEICPRPESICSFLENSGKSFRWLNLYRPLDYIGGRLSASACSIREIRIPCWTRGHTNYWGDEFLCQALRTLETGEKERTDIRLNRVNGKTIVWWPQDLTVVPEDCAFSWLWRRRPGVLRVLPKLLGPFAIAWGVLQLYELRKFGVFNPHAGSQIAGAFCALGFLRVSDKHFRDTFVRPWLGTLLASSEGLQVSSSALSTERQKSPVAIFRRLLAILGVSLSILFCIALIHLHRNRTWIPGATAAYGFEPKTVAFSKDGLVLAASGRGMGIWHVEGFSQVDDPPRWLQGSAAQIIYIGPDLQYVLIAEGHGNVGLHKVNADGIERDGKLIANERDFPVIGPEGAYFAVAPFGANPPTVSIVDVKTRETKRIVRLSVPLPFYSHLVAFSPDRQCLAVAQPKEIIEVTDFTKSQETSFKVDSVGREITALAYSNDCEYVGIGFTDSIEVYDRLRKRISRQVLSDDRGRRRQPDALAFWPKDKHVIVTGGEYGLQFWDWTHYHYLKREAF